MQENGQHYMPLAISWRGVKMSFYSYVIISPWGRGLEQVLKIVCLQLPAHTF
jgi:hypothetical protein